MQRGTIIYLVYFVFSIGWLIALKTIKIDNKYIRQERHSMLEFFFHMCILAVPGFLLVHYFVNANGWNISLYLRAYGKAAFLYLILALSVSPVVSLIKNRAVADTLILMRKVLGILSFLFFVRHGIEYFTVEYIFTLKHVPAITYLDYVTQNILIRNDALTWVIAGILMLVLGLTSNKVSMKILSGNLWKKVQSLVYPTFLIVSIHVAFSSRFDIFYVMLIVWLVYIRTMSYIIQKEKVQQGPTSKYLCVPCGYIYDEALGDPDGGLAPGTKFDDIPDSRVCPVCGVTKTSFEPYYESTSSSTSQNESSPVIKDGHMSKVSNYVMLTSDVLELTLETEDQLAVLPGQYATLNLKDFDGEFTRAYSIVSSTANTLTFRIKLKDTGRAWRAFRSVKVWNDIKIKKILWNFVLKNTSNPKIFIGTGTGLAPLYSMISQNTFSQNNMLFWWVRTQEDLFHMDLLTTLPNTQSEFFLSQQDATPYHYGRVHTDDQQFPQNAEFYLCGNKPMVVEQMASLKSRGYTNIYLEIF